MLVAQSCPTLGDPKDCSPRGSSVPGILQERILENSMGRGAWWATVHGVAKGWTQLSTHTHKILNIVPCTIH